MADATSSTARSDSAAPAEPHLVQPAPERTATGTLGALLGVAVSVLWLLNLSGGFIELPDNLPIVGNLDEVFFSGVLFACLGKLGISLPGRGRR